jgi:hypothetical protein
LISLGFSNALLGSFPHENADAYPPAIFADDLSALYGALVLKLQLAARRR